MPKRESAPKGYRVPDGTILKQNLIRLGWSEPAVKTTEIAKLVAAKTGRSMSRQRISSLLNAINIQPETIKTIAKAIGVKPEELTKENRS